MLQTLLVVDADVIDRMGGMIRHLCIGMIDEAVQVTVLNRSADGEMETGLGLARVVHLPPTGWLWGRPTPETILHAIGGQKPEVVHCLSAHLARWLIPCCDHWGSVLAVQLADLHDADQFTRLRSRSPMMGIAMAGSIERALVADAPELADAVCVVPPGLPAQSEAIALSDPEQTPAAVVTAPLTRKCGLYTIFKAMKMVIQAGHEVHLFVLSSGRAELAYRRAVDYLKLRPWVTFAGQLRDWATLRKAMLTADFYIAPSATARFEMSGLTALAGGMVIFAAKGTTEDYLIDNRTAVLFDHARPKQLAEKWSALLENRDLARQLACGALEYARTHHQAATMVTRIASLYRQLCQRGEPVLQTNADAS